MQITPSGRAVEHDALRSNRTNADDIEDSTGDVEEDREPSPHELLVNTNLSSVTHQARNTCGCTSLAAAIAAYTYTFETDKLAKGATRYLEMHTPFKLVKGFKKNTFFDAKRYLKTHTPLKLVKGFKKNTFFDAKRYLKTHTPFKLVKGFKKNTDRDYCGLWSSGTECILNFKGSNTVNDFINDLQADRVSAWGLRDIHKGIKRELKGLLEKMDFELIRNTCKGKTLSVTGHSLGGGMAQLFAVLLNKKEDPLKAGIKVDYIFVFGAMPVAVQTLTNDATSNGEFKGFQFYNAMPRGLSKKDCIDLLKMKAIGADRMQPVNCDKVVMTGSGDGERTYLNNSKYIENKDKMFADFLDKIKWTKYHEPKKYMKNLGCPDFKSFNRRIFSRTRMPKYD